MNTASIRTQIIEFTRRPLGIAAVAGLLGAIVLVFFLTRPGDPDPSGGEAAAPAGMDDMQGMEMGGMNMSTDGSIRLTADQLRQFGVTFGSVERRVLVDEVRTVGIVGFDETRMAEVAPKFGGFIERLHVNFTGQPVRAGQPVAEIYSPELVSAQEELLLAARLDANLSGSSVPGISGSTTDLAQVARRRLQLWDISNAQINDILKTGRVRRTLTIHSPVSGVVIEKSVLQGQAVQPGQTLYTIADLSRVWVEAELREADAGSVREGSTAQVELNAFPGAPIAGRVEYVYPTFQSETRTLKARIAIANPDGRIKPGMYATVRLSSPSRSALTVPSSAVVNTGERSIAFVDIGGGSLMPVEVETGRISGALTEILRGLEPGQRVVTSAQFILDSESNLAEVMKGMIGMGGSMEGMDMGGGADMKGMDMPRKER
jgi:Cu(I)/Ag(I) efflux system membrane fusion protein